MSQELRLREEVIHVNAENEVDAASDADNGEGGDLYD